MEMNMRLIGANKVEDLNPSMLDIKSLFTHTLTPADHLATSIYDPLVNPPQRVTEKAKL